MAEDEILETELIVLGGGPGGYPAAFAAADRGMKVTLVDEGITPGGVCLYRGCIPSKALLHISHLIHQAKEATQWGVHFGEPQIKLHEIRDYKNQVISKMTEGVSSLCKSRGITLIQGHGKFTGPEQIEVTGVDGDKQKIQFNNAIISTGSSPFLPEVFRFDDPRIMDSTAALELEDLPQKLLIIGAGVIGLEIGSIYSSLGSEVTLVEMTTGMLPGVDRDLVGPLRRKMASQLKAMHFKTTVKEIKPGNSGISVKLEGEDVVADQIFDQVLISIGRKPNSSHIGLENLEIETDERGFITVNRRQQTSVKHIYAIGDVAGEPMLAHKATAEAKVAACMIGGKPAEFDRIAVPSVVYTDPEVAWCGLTETEAKQNKQKINVSRFPWAASGRAQSMSCPDGITKIICDPDTERILGVGIVGTGAGELIAEGVLAVETSMTARELAECVHPHPTLSETLMESAEAVFGQATHIHRKKKR